MKALKLSIVALVLIASNAAKADESNMPMDLDLAVAMQTAQADAKQAVRDLSGNFSTTEAATAEPMVIEIGEDN